MHPISVTEKEIPFARCAPYPAPTPHPTFSDKLSFSGIKMFHVIANQPAGWCGDPVDFVETIRDCHVGTSFLLAMTCFFFSAPLNV